MGKFSLLVIFVDSMLGREALLVLTNLSRLMAATMYEPIPHKHGWINGRIATTVVRLYSKIIKRARLPITLWEQEPDRDPASSVGLAQ